MEHNNISAKMGGRLGDFFHSLVFANYYHTLYNRKTNLFLQDRENNFDLGVQRTYLDLKNIVVQQPYINSFSLLENDDTHIDFDLNKFRDTPWVFNTAWTDVVVKTQLPNLTHRFKNIKTLYLENDKQYANTVVIHRKSRGGFNEHIKFAYEQAIKRFNCVFLVQEHNKHLYDAFPLKNKPELMIVDTLEDVCKVINSAKYYIGNETAMTAIAHLTNTPRLIEMIEGPDAVHYTEEVKYFNNLSYIINAESGNYYIDSNSIFYGI